MSCSVIDFKFNKKESKNVKKIIFLHESAYTWLETYFLKTFKIIYLFETRMIIYLAILDRIGIRIIDHSLDRYV